MVRYRELRTITQLRKEFPFYVEIPIPAGGLQCRLDLLENWLSKHLHRSLFGRWGIHRNQQDIAVWGFQNASEAEAFRKYSLTVGALTDRQAINRLKNPERKSR